MIKTIFIRGLLSFFCILVSNTGFSQAEGFVVIKSNPAGAEVFINGKSTNKNTPFQMQMKAGTYRFTLKLLNYRDLEVDVLISDGQTISKDINMKPAFGSVSITSEPTGALILLDGKPTNQRTPFTLEKIPSGTHTITLSRDMYSDASQRIDVKDEQTSKVFLELMAGYGTIGIVAKPDASINIDGNSISNGSYTGRLAPGIHLVEAKRDKFYSQRKEINVISGEEMKLNFELLPILGSLSVMCEPIETEIFLNGKSYGYSPKIISDLIIGNYSLELKKPGFIQVSREISINENKSTIINELLTQGIIIRITSDPVNAELKINGNISGNTPQSIFTKPGSFNFKLEKEFYNVLEKTLFIRNDTVVMFNLTNKFKNIHISSFPEGSDYSINGRKMGYTPATLELPHGNHTITISRNKYYTYELNLKLDDNFSQIINPTLQKEYPNRATALAINLIYPGGGNTYLTGKKGSLLIGATFYVCLIAGLIQNPDANNSLAGTSILYYVLVNPLTAFFPDKSKFRNLPRKY